MACGDADQWTPGADASACISRAWLETTTTRQRWGRDTTGRENGVCATACTPRRRHCELDIELLAMAEEAVARATNVMHAIAQLAGMPCNAPSPANESIYRVSRSRGGLELLSNKSPTTTRHWHARGSAHVPRDLMQPDNRAVPAQREPRSARTADPSCRAATFASGCCHSCRASLPPSVRPPRHNSGRLNGAPPRGAPHRGRRGRAPPRAGAIPAGSMEHCVCVRLLGSDCVQATSEARTRPRVS